MEEELKKALEWYAKETNRKVEELDDFDLYICEVIAKYGKEAINSN